MNSTRLWQQNSETATGKWALVAARVDRVDPTRAGGGAGCAHVARAIGDRVPLDPLTDRRRGVVGSTLSRMSLTVVMRSKKWSLHRLLLTIDSAPSVCSGGRSACFTF